MFKRMFDEPRADFFARVELGFAGSCHIFMAQLVTRFDVGIDVVTNDVANSAQDAAVVFTVQRCAAALGMGMVAPVTAFGMWVLSSVPAVPGLPILLVTVVAAAENAERR